MTAVKAQPKITLERAPEAPKASNADGQKTNNEPQEIVINANKVTDSKTGEALSQKPKAETESKATESKPTESKEAENTKTTKEVTDKKEPKAKEEKTEEPSGFFATLSSMFTKAVDAVKGMLGMKTSESNEAEEEEEVIDLGKAKVKENTEAQETKSDDDDKNKITFYTASGIEKTAIDPNNISPASKEIKSQAEKVILAEINGNIVPVEISANQRQTADNEVRVLNLAFTGEGQAITNVPMSQLVQVTNTEGLPEGLKALLKVKPPLSKVDSPEAAKKVNNIAAKAKQEKVADGEEAIQVKPEAKEEQKAEAKAQETKPRITYEVLSQAKKPGKMDELSIGDKVIAPLRTDDGQTIYEKSKILEIKDEQTVTIENDSGDKRWIKIEELQIYAKAKTEQVKPEAKKEEVKTGDAA